MAYQALYRKWRPMVFDDVVGQQHITTTIKNEILTGKMSHAYLFTGTRGTGKTSTAKIFSRAVNCTASKDGNPCNECDICRGILSERILDVIEIDAASNNGVDNIRDIIDQTKYAAAEGSYRVYIIDEVHMLSPGAFNALLKTLEEPTQGVIFILATTEIHKVPATIMSRCQRFDFKTINNKDIADRIKYILEQEGIRAEDEAIEYVARLGEGSMRDSLSILDQCLAFKPNDLTVSDVTETVGAVDTTFLYDIARYVAEENVRGAVGVFEDCIKDGKNTDYFAQGLLEVYRNMLLYKVSGDIEYAGLKYENTQKTAEKYTVEKLMYCVETVSALINRIKFASSPRVFIEMAIVKMSAPALDDSPSAILSRLAKIENMLSTGKVSFTAAAADIPVMEEADLPPWEISPEKAPEAPQENPEPSDKNEVAEDACGDNASVSAESKSNAQTVCDSWSDLLTSIMGDGKITLYMAVKDAVCHSTENTLELVFADAEGRDNCAKAENKVSLAESIKSLFGFDVEVKILTKTQHNESRQISDNDVFGKIEQFSKEFPENIEI